MFTKHIVHLLCLSLVVSVIHCPARAQKLIWLGTLGGQWSYAAGVSADGSVVVGESEAAEGAERAFRWSPTTGMVDLGTLGGNWSYASAVSADGSTVVGTASRDDGTYRAFRWTLAGGMVELSTITGSSLAFGVSADGGIVVGTLGGGSATNAIRWLLSGAAENLLLKHAFGVSADGNLVAGVAWGTNWRNYASIWTPVSGTVRLGSLGEWSYALGVSANGGVVVGETLNPESLRRAFRWSPAEGMLELLPPIGFRESSAMAVSADGLVIVGEAMNPDDGGHAVWWKDSTVGEDLNETIAPLLAEGSILSFAAGVSPDGRYIVGGGYNASTGRWEAFLVDTAVRYAISGRLELQDYTGDITQIPITVEVRRDGIPVLQQAMRLDSDGTYTLTGLGVGTYDLSFSASHWLRRLVRRVVVAGSDVSGVDAILINGDIDGDNEVTLFDFGQLVFSFGSTPGDYRWNPNADLDGDEEVSLFDFGILVRNFGAIGDE
ncbi:MAG: hypothetical protein KatS3mg023_2442 [Armatimonadota bacterium]|nr:MAG: hypothetical protein KatS3mg023_2442 [Armatimonadota bacterium]